MTRVFVYETTSADPRSADPALRLQGQAMLAAMVADLAGIRGLEVTAAVGNDPFGPVIDGVRQAKQGRDESALAFLRRQAAVHDLVWVVAPETGGLLSALRAAVTDDQWLGCSREAIDIAASKRRTARLLDAAGIAATRPLPLDSPFVPEASPGSWIVKPDDGCGAIGARRYQDYVVALADYRERRLHDEDVVMEPWVGGEPLSLSLLCRQHEVEVLALNRQLISFDRDGWLRFDGVIATEAANAEQMQAMSLLAADVIKALPGLAGFVGLDVTWQPGRAPVVIEINPRLTCAYPALSARLGRNLATEMLAAHRQRTRDARGEKTRGTRGGCG